MASQVATDAVLTTPIDKKRPLLGDKAGVPLNRQIPRTQQVYTGNGAVPITLDGSNSLLVTGALAAPLVVNATSVNNLIQRAIAVYVRGGVGQNVVINFPVAGYPVYSKGAAGTVTTITLPVSANNQNLFIDFGATAAYIG